MTTTANHEQVGTPIVLKDLSLKVGSRTLLSKTNAHFQPGQITLIVGPSGCGKSTLLRALAGISDSLEVSGTISFSSKPAASVGMVFQRFALFDELSPSDNLRLALDHRAVSGKSQTAGDLLVEFDIPESVPTGSLSGGQQQRLAIARTLAYDASIVLYDEPTSGLDIATGKKVARLIRETQEHHPKTSIVVTHDYETLAPIADRVYLLDPSKKELREIDSKEWNRLGEMMQLRLLPELETVPDQTHGKGVLAACRSFFSGTTVFLERLLALPLCLLPLWKSPLWGARFCLHYLRLVAGPLAMVYVALAGVVVGFVATYFTFHFLPYKPITEPLFLENVLEALGFSLYRILVPVLITVLVAARCGAAVASDVGGKVHGQQIDAMRTLGIRPERYLQTPILYSLLLGTPVLVFLAFVLARFTSLCVFTVSHPNLGPYFWDAHFHRGLLWPDHWLYRGSGWLLIKLLCCAVGIAFSSYEIGMLPKPSTRSVSSGITLNILLSTIYVLLVHMTFALFEFD
jgi:ABC-type multidrug transport system ATPase subunit/ABC-type transporter Mla maintaining outer membrane lipid asymmetry permease subunit MlaE